jgi:hypothetical protein
MGCGHHGGGLLGFKKFGLVFRRKFQGLFHEPGLASRLASAGAPCDSAQGHRPARKLFLAGWEQIQSKCLAFDYIKIP